MVEVYSKDGKWWFRDDHYDELHGPYDTEEEANNALCRFYGW